MQGKISKQRNALFFTKFPACTSYVSGKFRRQSTLWPSVTECEVVGRGHPPISLFTGDSRLIKTDWTYAILGCTMHVVFSYARAEHNIVTTWIWILMVCTHHVPDELISFLIQNAKSDALISLQPTSRW